MIDHRVRSNSRSLLVYPEPDGKRMEFPFGQAILQPWGDNPEQFNSLSRLMQWWQQQYKEFNLQSGFNADLWDGHHWSELEDLFQPLCDYLTALCELPDDGLVVKDGDVAHARTLVSDHLALVIDDGDGLAGNPTFDLDESLISHSLLDDLDADDHLQYMLRTPDGAVVAGDIPAYVDTSGRELEASGFDSTDLQNFADAIAALGDYANADFSDSIVHTGDFEVQGKFTADEIDPFVVAFTVSASNPYALEALADTSMWARDSDDRLMWGEEEVAYVSDITGGSPAAQLDADGTTLDVDGIADGEYLRRVGTSVVGATVAGGDRIAKATAANVAINSTSVVNIASVSNAIAAGDGFEFELVGAILNNSGSTRTYTVRVTVGATTFDLAFEATVAASASNRTQFTARGYVGIHANNLIYAQVEVDRGAPAAIATIQADVLAQQRQVFLTSTNDETGTKTVAIGVFSSNATATQTLHVAHCSIRK